MTDTRITTEDILGDLKRTATPHEVREGDTNFNGKRVRMRVVTMVSGDQNHLHRLVKILGPATGEDSLIIPCGGGVELAQVEDIIIAAKERRTERARIRALVLPERQARMDRLLTEMAETEITRRKGSSFGPAGIFQR